MDKYEFDLLDLEFILYIKDELEKRIGEDSIPALMESPFLRRLQEDPSYVHHYDVQYWADYIMANYEKKDVMINN